MASDVLTGAATVFGGVLGNATWVIGLIFVALIGVFFVWIASTLSKYNIKIEIVEPRGNGLVTFRKRGGIIKNKDTESKDFVILTSSMNPWRPLVTMPVPSKDSYWQDKKGKRILRIYMTSEDSCEIIKPFKPGDISEKPMDIEWLNWGALNLKGKAERYRKDPNWVEKYGTLLGFGMISTILVVIIIFGFQEGSEWSNALARTAEAQADMTKSLERINIETKGTQIIDLPSGEGITSTTPTEFETVKIPLIGGDS